MPGTLAQIAQVNRVPDVNPDVFAQSVVEARSLNDALKSVGDDSGTGTQAGTQDMSEIVNQLKEMGFEEALVVQSLFDNDKNFDRTLEQLLRSAS